MNFVYFFSIYDENIEEFVLKVRGSFEKVSKARQYFIDKLRDCPEYWVCKIDVFC